tara:strand:- start:10799 stop:11614 length:816 start_codon:yes stop_codon:yes gene_type:complete
MIIEFIGLPCSGKTYNYLKIKNNLKNKIFNYIDIYYLYTKKIINLNLFQSILFKISYSYYKKNLRNYNFYNNKIKKKNKLNLIVYLKKIIKKIIVINEESIKKKILKLISLREREILKILYYCVNNSPLNLNEKKILKDRVEKEFIGLILIKKMKLNKLIILNDEGFIQRILSAYKKEKNLNINKKKLFKFFEKFQKLFNINFVIVVKTNINKIFSRAKQRNRGFNYNNFSYQEIQNWDKLFNNLFFKNKIVVLKNNNTKKIVNLIKSAAK